MVSPISNCLLGPISVRLAKDPSVVGEKEGRCRKRLVIERKGIGIGNVCPDFESRGVSIFCLIGE